MDLSLETKLHAFELAERTVTNSVIRSTAGTYEGTASKSLREITSRADQILAWATGTEEADKATLISKLRDVLCSSDK